MPRHPLPRHYPQHRTIADGSKPSNASKESAAVPPPTSGCEPCKASVVAAANGPALTLIPLPTHHHQHPANANKRGPSNVSKANTAAPLPTLPCARQCRGLHARDAPCGGGSGNDVGVGGEEQDGNGRGGSNGGSRRGGQWAGWAMLCSIFFLSQNIFLTLTATATEGRGNGSAAVLSSADPFI
jgi:hypothetical protein